MFAVSIITRRLKEGKTYDDFRKAWFHTTGFGVSSKLYTMINAFDPQEIIVVGFVEIREGEDPLRVLNIEVKERQDNPLDSIVEPEIGRVYGVLVSEDDFSATGAIDYRPASIHGQPTDFSEVTSALSLAKTLITQASRERDKAKEILGGCH
jgi:hypothetical protein